jgi:hypothetical protein
MKNFKNSWLPTKISAQQCRKANTAHYHCGRPGYKTHDICEAIRKEREKMDNNKTYT